MNFMTEMLKEEGVLCPEHGVDYDLECEKCNEVTLDWVVKNGFYIVFLKILQISREPLGEPWDSDSFLFYMRGEKAIHEGELKKAREQGDRDGELREAGFVQAMGFVIGALMEE